MLAILPLVIECQRLVIETNGKRIVATGNSISSLIGRIGSYDPIEDGKRRLLIIVVRGIREAGPSGGNRGAVGLDGIEERDK
jgi:hypothetical protein